MVNDNLLENIPVNLQEEIFQNILSHKEIKIERIISKGHCSEPDFWYDQDQNEWVLLIKGEAKLQFEKNIKHLLPGDYVNIPAHTRHRVEWTTPKEETIWLAIFY
jgi:cupin 2 domain-containing protein